MPVIGRQASQSRQEVSPPNPQVAAVLSSMVSYKESSAGFVDAHAAVPVFEFSRKHVSNHAQAAGPRYRMQPPSRKTPSAHGDPVNKIGQQNGVVSADSRRNRRHQASATAC